MSDDWSGNLLERWRRGDQAAAEELFHRYAGQLVALTRNRLAQKIARRVDAEDVVQSVYRSFFNDARDGRFELKRAGDLWRLLVTITLAKLRNQVKHNQRARRAVMREKAFGSEDSLLELLAASRTPSALEAVALADELEGLLRRLQPLHRQVVEWRLQGHSLEEISALVDRSERTVYRILEGVKLLLQE